MTRSNGRTRRFCMGRIRNQERVHPSSGGAEGAHPQRLAADDRRAGGGGIDAAPERWEAQKGSRAPEQWYWRW